MMFNIVNLGIRFLLGTYCMEYQTPIQNVDNSMPFDDTNGLPREAINRGLAASSLKNMNC